MISIFMARIFSLSLWHHSTFFCFTYLYGPKRFTIIAFFAGCAQCAGNCFFPSEWRTEIGRFYVIEMHHFFSVFVSKQQNIHTSTQRQLSIFCPPNVSHKPIFFPHPIFAQPPSNWVTANAYLSRYSLHSLQFSYYINPHCESKQGHIRPAKSI